MTGMKIRITFEVHDESADPDDITGVTNEAWEEIFDAISSHGEEIDIKKDEA